MTTVHHAVAARSRHLLMAAGLAALVILATLASTLGDDARERSGRTGGSSAAGPDVAVVGAPDASAAGRGSQDAEEAKVGVAATSDAVATDSAPVTTLAAPQIDARIVRTAGIGLRVRRARFEGAWTDAQAVAGAMGGMVGAASRSGTGDAPRVGTMTLRVPSAKFDAAVERLRGVDGARVERLDVASEDVTQEFVDTGSRLRHDRAVEGRLLALLADTEGVGEVLAVQARLDQVQEQIEISQGRIRYLEARTSTSTIELSLRAPAAAGASDEETSTSPLDDAFDRASARFQDNVASAVEWLGGALPALLLLAITAVTARTVLRRRAAGAGRTSEGAGGPGASVG